MRKNILPDNIKITENIQIYVDFYMNNEYQRVHEEGFSFSCILNKTV